MSCCALSETTGLVPAIPWLRLKLANWISQAEYAQSVKRHQPLSA